MTFAPHMQFPGKQGIPQIGGQFVTPGFKQEIPEISIGPYTGQIGEGFGPIGTYDPEQYPTEVVPLVFLNNFLDERLLAKGKSPFSTPHWDKQDDIRKYLDNDKRLIDSLIRRGKIKV